MNNVTATSARDYINKVSSSFPNGHCEFTINPEDSSPVSDKHNSKIWGSVISRLGEAQVSQVISRQHETNVVYINPHNL